MVPLWYLVKWRDLPYDQATWEAEDAVIPELNKYIEDYYCLRYSYSVITALYQSQVFTSFNTCLHPWISAIIIPRDFIRFS